MSNLANMAASNFELDINGEIYPLKQLTLGVYADMESAILSNKINLLKQHFSGKELHEMVEDLLEKGVKDFEKEKFLGSVKGTKYLLKKCLVKKVSEDELDSMLTEENLASVVKVLVNVQNAKKKVSETKK